MSTSVILDIDKEESKDDEYRKELLWENREERLLLGWVDEIKIRTVKHSSNAKKNKIKYALFGVPSILIPISLGGLSSVIPEHSLIYSVGMMISGVFSGISMFFNFGKKAQSHSEFSNKFFELTNEINSELSKPKAYRVACDVYMTQIKINYNSLCKHAPDI
jgi:hypothetical protein